MVGSAVAAFHDAEKLAPMLQELGIRYAAYSFMVATMLAGFVCSKCWLKLQTALRKAQLLVKQRRAPGWLLFCQMNRMLSEVSLQQKKSLGLSLLVDCCLLQFTVKAVKD